MSLVLLLCIGSAFKYVNKLYYTLKKKPVTFTENFRTVDSLNQYHGIYSFKPYYRETFPDDVTSLELLMM